MSLRAAKEELEEYFVKKYPEKYAELGGYFYAKGYKSISKSKMYRYFSFGQYIELNDPELEKYWKEIKKQELKWNVLVVIVVVLFYVLSGE